MTPQSLFSVFATEELLNYSKIPIYNISVYFQNRVYRFNRINYISLRVYFLFSVAFLSCANTDSSPLTDQNSAILKFAQNV